MINLKTTGRIFYGIAILGIGSLMIYYSDFPYMLIPPRHSWIPGLKMVASVFGFLFILTGACIVLQRKIKTASLLLGTFLLLIFCFYFIPFQLFISANNMHFVDWENAAKELALCAGAFLLAGAFIEKNEPQFIGNLSRLIPLGTIGFSLAIISFGIVHFLHAKDVAAYEPTWVPYKLFWAYFTGTALLGSGIAIILNIKAGLAAALLGAMTFSWVIILHIPRIIASPAAYIGSEIASTCIALAYSGIAFAIAHQSFTGKTF